ncbi:hypothetical protein Tco_1490644 [Tanacetum coccineum]
MYPSARYEYENEYVIEFVNEYKYEYVNKYVKEYVKRFESEYLNKPFALALYSALMVAMRKVSRADASPQVLHMQNIIVYVSSVLIVVSRLSGIGLFADLPKEYYAPPMHLLKIDKRGLKDV